MCPAGLECLSPPDVPESVCVERCDSVMVHCGPGMICLFHRGVRVCWPGGDLPEGASSRDALACQRGLALRPDYEAEPLAYTCEPLCETSGDCRAGETCDDGLTCAVPCAGPGAAPCGAGSTCVQGFCLNARRFAQIDCDGNGRVDGPADCPPGGMCDDTIPDRICIPAIDP